MKRTIACMGITVAAVILLTATYAPANDSGPVDSKVSTVTKTATSQPAKSEVKVTGKVEVSKEKTKLEVEKKAEETDIAQIGTWIIDMIDAFKNGKVWDGIAILLMLATFIIGLLKKDIPPKFLPWIAAGLGMGTNIVSAIIGGVGWDNAIISGLFQGAAAAGFWSMIGKHIFRSKEEKVKRDQAREIVASNGVTSGEMES